MVRTPCCLKIGLKKGAWSPEEDQILIAYIKKHGPGNWRALPEKAGLLRCGKSCRFRWTNYLRPDVKIGNYSKEEEEAIIWLHGRLGNRWSMIAASLPGRTDNEIKNVWNSHLKNRSKQDPMTQKSNGFAVELPERNVKTKGEPQPISAECNFQIDPRSDSSSYIHIYPQTSSGSSTTIKSDSSSCITNMVESNIDSCGTAEEFSENFQFESFHTENSGVQHDFPLTLEDQVLHSHFFPDLKEDSLCGSDPYHDDLESFWSNILVEAEEYDEDLNRML